METIARTVEVIDLNVYTPEYYDCANCGERIERHILQEGARYHVLHWDTQGEHCSERDCVTNHKCEGKTLEVKL